MTGSFLIGSYGPGADAILTFTAEVTGDNLYEGINELESTGQIRVGGRVMQDSATVIVHSGEETEPGHLSWVASTIACSMTSPAMAPVRRGRRCIPGPCGVNAYIAMLREAQQYVGR